jgi:hypothetical protein
MRPEAVRWALAAVCATALTAAATGYPGGVAAASGAATGASTTVVAAHQASSAALPAPMVVTRLALCLVVTCAALLAW